MEGECGTSNSEPHRAVGFLHIQSEELARKLQCEADVNDGVVFCGDSSAANEPAFAARSPSVAQGAWGTPGRSGADLLRSSADPPFPSSQQNSNRVDARNASSSTPPKASSTTTDTAVLPGVPLSATAVGALVEMGIKESWAAAALRRCGGSDIARAVEFSFSHDMESLAEEDAASHASTAQPNVDVDADMAFALALEQEERRVFEARRSAAAATMAAEGGSFGPKVRVALHAASDGVSASSSTAVEKSERWGLAEADAFVGGDGVEMSPGGGSGEWKTGEEEEDGGGGGELRVIPGGGRRKGKMPLFKNAAGEVVSKHDAVICGRMNAMEASGLEGVGDLPAAGVRLDNRTFNSLRRDIRKKHEKGVVKGERVEGATRSTQEGVMDPRTRLLVFKMLNAGVLLKVGGVVKTGKEAHVYHALAPEENPSNSLGSSRGVALKIFKTTLNEFGNRAIYVDGDPRYPNMRFNKQSRSKMFSIWAKKEQRNLIRLHRSGLPCPEPILQREHILVMSFVGDGHWPAPQLRELQLSSTSKWRRCYLQVLELIRLMFRKCRLVHADLSEYNLLYHEKVCYVIDVGQAVDTGHPKARDFLSRDVSVVTDFFRRKGVSNCLQESVAEEFVVSYRGPSDMIESLGDRHGDEPPTGVEVISELMAMGGTTGGAALSELREALRSACEVAELWANGVDDDVIDNASDIDIDNIDDVELDGSTEEAAAGAAVPIGTTGVVDDVEEREGKGGVVRVEAESDHKVEIGERERARMADLKEALKAGVF